MYYNVRVLFSTTILWIGSIPFIPQIGSHIILPTNSSYDILNEILKETKVDKQCALKVENVIHHIKIGNEVLHYIHVKVK